MYEQKLVQVFSWIKSNLPNNPPSPLFIWLAVTLTTPNNAAQGWFDPLSSEECGYVGTCCAAKLPSTIFAEEKKPSSQTGGGGCQGEERHGDHHPSIVAEGMQEKKKKLRHQLGIRILTALFSITQTQGIHRFYSQILMILGILLKTYLGQWWNANLMWKCKALQRG